MKKINKITSLFIIIFLIVLTSCTYVFADPNSSKGFASYSDEQAEAETNKLIQEQANQHNVTEVKSTDNYLNSLQVEGYTITPSFDKQTLEYTIKEEVKTSEINIKVVTSSDKASVSGNGKIKLEEGKNEYRIDVTSEAGAVRTYIIKLNKSGEASTNETNTEPEPVNEVTNEVTNEIINEEITTEKTQTEEKNRTENSKEIKTYIIIAVAVVIFIVLLFMMRKSKKKGKH